MINKEINIILVDDSIHFRSAIKKFIETQFNFKVIAEAENGQDLISKYNSILDADLIIMDLMMPEMDGYATAKKITWQFQKVKIIAVTMHNDKAYLLKLIEQGFKGCIFKNQVYENLYNCIQNVLNGKLYFPKEILIK